MFKKYYKEANDDIKTNRELIGKILKEAEKPAKTKRFTSVYKFGMTAVAVLVLVISLSFIPNLLKREKENIPTSPNVPIAMNENIADEIVETTEEQGSKGKSEKPEESEVNVSDSENQESNANDDSSQNDVVQPIEPTETNNTEDSTSESPVLAMETGESQGFSIPRGRMVEAPQENTEYSVAVDEWLEVPQEKMENIAVFFS